MQCWGQDAQDHDFHGISHPAEASDKAQDDLEFAESQRIDGLRDGERVVRHHSRGCRRDLDFGPDDVIKRVMLLKPKKNHLKFHFRKWQHHLTNLFSSIFGFALLRTHL